MTIFKVLFWPVVNLFVGIALVVTAVLTAFNVIDPSARDVAVAAFWAAGIAFLNASLEKTKEQVK